MNAEHPGEIGPLVEWLAEVIYDAWCEGLDDSRASVGHKTKWADVSPRNRARFYEWAKATPLPMAAEIGSSRDGAT